jgi:hypothetical protein
LMKVYLQLMSSQATMGRQMQVIFCCCDWLCPASAVSCSFPSCCALALLKVLRLVWWQEGERAMMCKGLWPLWQDRWWNQCRIYSIIFNAPSNLHEWSSCHKGMLRNPHFILWTARKKTWDQGTGDCSSHAQNKWEFFNHLWCNHCW